MLFTPIVWGLLIPLSELIFNVVARKITDWENWRTVSTATHNQPTAALLTPIHSGKLTVPVPLSVCVLSCGRSTLCTTRR